MLQSILDSTKKTLGIDPSYTVFDEDILMHINSVFGTLKQLGLGPEAGFAIEDNTSTWDEFIGTDNRFNDVKSYVYLRVRLLFDPPGTSFHIAAIKEQIQELEWRLREEREGTAWVPPITELDEDVVNVDGGVI